MPSPCSWLEGSLTLAKEDSVKKCDSLPFQYVLLESPKKSNGSASSASSGESKEAAKSKFDEYKENLRDFFNNSIVKLEPTNAEEVYKTLVKDYPEFYQAHMSMIQNLENNSSIKVQYPFSLRNELMAEGAKAEDVQSLEKTCNRIIELSNLILQGINLDELLCYYGLKVDFRPDAAKLKVQMDKQKILLVEAFVKKLVATGKLVVLSEKRKSAGETEDDQGSTDQAGLRKQINNMYVEASKLIDMGDSRVAMINVWHSYVNQQWGRFGKHLNKLYEEKQQKEVLQEMRTMFKSELKWEHVSKFLDKYIVTANPQGYRLF